MEARRIITFPGGVKRKIAEVVLVHLSPAPELDRWFGEMKCKCDTATRLQPTVSENIIRLSNLELRHSIPSQAKRPKLPPELSGRTGDILWEPV